MNRLSPVDFANTVACASCGAEDAFASPKSAYRWMIAHGVKFRGRAARFQMSRLRAIRDSVRALLDAAAMGARPPSKALTAVNEACKTGVVSPSLAWGQGRWTSSSLPLGGTPTDWIGSEVARSIVSLLTGPDGPKIRRCQAPGCAHFLLARTRQQRWCSPTGCGNRVRVARHYRRARSQGSAASSQAPRTSRDRGSRKGRRSVARRRDRAAPA